MKDFITFAAAVPLFAIMILTAGAQPVQSGQTHYYDPKTEVTLTGTVERIDRTGSPDMAGKGLHLILKTANEVANVHLGPAAFIEGMMTFKKGDVVQIIGSKVTMLGKTVVVAREVKKGEEVLTLRDENGVPVWPRKKKPVS